MAKSKLTEDLIREAAKLASIGLKDKDVCKAVGISQAAFYAWMHDADTDLKRKLVDEMDKARAMRKAALLQTVVKASQEGAWQAAAWYLERAYPQEYGRCQRLPEKDEKALDAVRKLMEAIEVKADAAQQ